MHSPKLPTLLVVGTVDPSLTINAWYILAHMPLTDKVLSLPLGSRWVILLQPRGTYIAGPFLGSSRIDCGLVP